MYESEIYLYYEACQDPQWFANFMESSKDYELEHLDWDFINRMFREDEEYDHSKNRITLMTHALQNKIILKYYYH